MVEPVFPLDVIWVLYPVSLSFLVFSFLKGILLMFVSGLNIILLDYNEFELPGNLVFYISSVYVFLINLPKSLLLSLGDYFRRGTMEVLA
jgi:hypothetical protein